MLTWRELREALKDATDEQLNMPVVALIDLEPWDAAAIKVASAESDSFFTDEWRPNTLYLIFE